MAKLSVQQQALEISRDKLTQYFSKSSVYEKPPKSTPEEQERINVRIKLDDGEIHPKIARMLLRRIIKKYSSST
jgi:hypothetical protein